ncbi:hypothetical protein Mapa_010251 [Marchantia paleacea]|nr:hypothetical protein Mapa_010251 [Marchantia paleacea]
MTPDGSRTGLGLSIVAIIMGSCFATFDQEFIINWSRENVAADDANNEVKISLNRAAGAQFTSTHSFLYGSFSVKVKLVPGDSAGTVSSFYLTSSGSQHDEIDFEFLGNETGQPYVLHTNVFANGTGNREQRIFLWFDPTAEFHNYSVIWNHQQIMWLVDDTPIRVYKNVEKLVPKSYPHFQPMVVAASIFDGSDWATLGGAVPTNWEHAPFVVTYKDFNFDACIVQSNSSSSSCTPNYESNWWEAAPFQSLDAKGMNDLKEIYQKYIVYDYCTDRTRNPTPPQECSYNT